MMIFNELRKHGRLAAKRHPMYEKNKVAKILGYVMGAFWAGYLIFFGTTFAFAIDGGGYFGTGTEPDHSDKLYGRSGSDGI